MGFSDIPVRSASQPYKTDHVNSLRTAGAALETQVNDALEGRLRLEVLAEQPALAPPAGYAYLYPIGTNLFIMFDDYSTSRVGSGGGGGLAVVWSEADNGPIPSQYNGLDVYLFEAGKGQVIPGYFKVPESHSPGSVISLVTSFFAESPTGNIDWELDSYLYRRAVDPLDAYGATENSLVSTSMTGTSKKQQRVTLEVTDADGLIGGLAVNPGDLIRVNLKRNASDTCLVDAQWFKNAEIVIE